MPDLIRAAQHVHKFPPPFDSNPLSYGYALFGLTLVAAVALAHLLAFVGDARRYAVAVRHVQGWTWTEAPRLTWSLLGVWRGLLASFWAALFLATSPDVLIMFMWGEASDATMASLYMVDRLFDGSVIYPVIIASALQLWVSQAMPQTLANVSHLPLGQPRLVLFSKYLKISVVVLVIAAGITIGKASA